MRQTFPFSMMFDRIDRFSLSHAVMVTILLTVIFDSI